LGKEAGNRIWRLSGGHIRRSAPISGGIFPAQFNIADVICDRHVASSRTALLVETAGGRMADDLRTGAGALAAIGERIEFARVKRGDRVTILLPQCPETLIAADSITASEPGDGVGKTEGSERGVRRFKDRHRVSGQE
jgi:hypothetical protein